VNHLEHVPLRDLVSQVYVWNRPNVGGSEIFDYIDLGAVDQERKVIAGSRKIRAIEAPSRARQLLVADDIIVSTVRPNLNSVAQVRERHNGAIASTGFCVLRSKKSALDPDYLFQWVKNPGFVQDMTRKATGASYPAVSDRIVLNSLIPLPSLSEQRRISKELGQAETLRHGRQEALAQLDELARSIFLEMFGHPALNPHGLPQTRLGDVGRLDRGVSKHRPRNAPDLLGGPYPLVQTGDVANCDGYIRSYVSSYSEHGLKQSRMWPAGTLCITIAANIAKTGILTFDACFPDSVVGFTSEDSATVEFVRSWLSFIQRHLEYNAPKSAQRNINLAILRNLEVPLPSLELRRKFAQCVERVEQVKVSQRAHLAELDALFASLQYRAFRGEL